MATLQEILTYLQHIAPESSALANDPVGMLIGSTEEKRDVRQVGVCLDATPEAARKAVDAGVDLVIAHHPLIYHPLKRLDSVSDPIARAVTTLVQADIVLYAMHTNWDRAEDGINDTLADLLGLQETRRLGEHGEPSLPRIGRLTSPVPLAEFTRQVEAALSCSGTSALRVNAVDPALMVSCVAVCGGAGASLASAVQAAGAEAYVTSDVRHHEFMEAAGRGLALLDAGHQATETPGMHTLARLITENLSSVKVTWVGPD